MILELVVSFSTVIIPKVHFDIVSEDPSDNKIIDCAVAADADFIISGDDHLLKIGDFRGIRIMRGAEFLRLNEVTTAFEDDAIDMK